MKKRFRSLQTLLLKRFLRRPNQRGVAWALLSVLNFSIMGLCVKYAAQQHGFHAAELVFWRMFPACLILGALALYRQKRFRTPHWRLHVRRSGAGTFSLLLNFHAIALLPLATAVTLAYSSSIFMALIAFFILRERVSQTTWLGIACGFGGVCLLLRPDLSASEWLGMAVALISAAGAAVAYLQLREVARTGEETWRVVFYFSLAATLACVLLNMYLGWHALSWAVVPVLSALSLSALLGQICLTRAYAVGQKFTVSVLSYATVMLSTLAAHVYLGEALQLQEILAIILIVMAGVLTSYRN